MAGKGLLFVATFADGAQVAGWWDATQQEVVMRRLVLDDPRDAIVTCASVKAVCYDLGEDEEPEESTEVIKHEDEFYSGVVRIGEAIALFFPDLEEW